MKFLKSTSFLWIMAKDKRYTTIKNLISGGHIKSFREIFDTLPKSVVYKDLGMNNKRFNRLMYNVEEFVVLDLFRIADLIGTNKKNILDLIYSQYIEDEKIPLSSGKP